MCSVQGSFVYSVQCTVCSEQCSVPYVVCSAQFTSYAACTSDFVQSVRFSEISIIWQYGLCAVLVPTKHHYVNIFSIFFFFN